MTDDRTEARQVGQADEPLALRLNDQLGPLPEPTFHGMRRGVLLREDAWTADQMREYAERAVARERQRTMFARRPGLWALQAREVLELIAAPQRPDGTWNRDREACRQMAAEALGRHED